MSDPLLSTLCSVCRIVPPKYKCPRCGARYCSVACNQRHRVRASCSGLRDETAFVPRARLETDAGIDHDFNFLRRIEQKRAAAERQFPMERRVLGEDGMGRGRGGGGGGGRPEPTNSSAVLLKKQWEGTELHFVPVESRQQQRNGLQNGLHRRVYALSRKRNVEIVVSPQGSVRRRQNNTVVRTWRSNNDSNKNNNNEDEEDQDMEDVKKQSNNHNNQDEKSQLIHWKVEWRIYSADMTAPPVRIFRRCREDNLLAQAFFEMQRNNADKLLSVQEGEAEDLSMTAADVDVFTFQNPATGAWETQRIHRSHTPHATAQYRFFLQRPRLPQNALEKTPSTTPPAFDPRTTQLIPLDPASDTLADALVGRTVLDFPTIYVLPAGVLLPHGHVLGSTARRDRHPDDDRQAAAAAAYAARHDGAHKRGRDQTGSSPMANKRQKAVDDDDGVVVSMDQNMDEDDDSETSSSGTSSDDDDDDGGDDDDDEMGEVEMGGVNGMDVDAMED